MCLAEGRSASLPPASAVGGSCNPQAGFCYGLYKGRQEQRLAGARAARPLTQAAGLWPLWFDRPQDALRLTCSTAGAAGRMYAKRVVCALASPSGVPATAPTEKENSVGLRLTTLSPLHRRSASHSPASALVRRLTRAVAIQTASHRACVSQRS